MMLKGKRSVRALICMFVIFTVAAPAFLVTASEKENTEVTSGQSGSVTGTLQQTSKAAEIKEKPDSDSNTLASLKKGTTIVVYEELKDSWSRIEYKGVEGYVESDALEQYQVEDGENLEQEFQTVEEDTLRTVDEYELLQKEKRTSRIWGAVIVVLVIVIFAVGIFSALQQAKEKEQEEQKGEKR